MSARYAASQYLIQITFNLGVTPDGKRLEISSVLLFKAQTADQVCWSRCSSKRWNPTEQWLQSNHSLTYFISLCPKTKANPSASHSVQVNPPLQIVLMKALLIPQVMFDKKNYNAQLFWWLAEPSLKRKGDVCDCFYTRNKWNKQRWRVLHTGERWTDVLLVLRSLHWIHWQQQACRFFSPLCIKHLLMFILFACNYCK